MEACRCEDSTEQVGKDNVEDVHQVKNIELRKAQSQHHGWVECTARDRTNKNRSAHDNKTNGHAVVGVIASIRVRCYAETNKAKQKRQNQFGKKGLESRVALTEAKSGQVATNYAAEQRAKEAADDLKDPVHEHLGMIQFSTESNSKRNGWIVMTSADGTAGLDDAGQHETNRNGRLR